MPSSHKKTPQNTKSNEICLTETGVSNTTALCNASPWKHLGVHENFNSSLTIIKIDKDGRAWERIFVNLQISL